MEEYRFGASHQAPRCWGKGFVEGDRECRGCGFQESCKNEIVRNSVNRPTMYQQPLAPPQYQPFPQPQPLQVPVYQPPVQQRVPRVFFGQPQSPVYGQQPMNQFPPQFQQQPIQYQQQPQQQQLNPYQQYGYGWAQDPMHHYVHTIPPPLRPQMSGESFGERMVKNVGLAMLESLFANVFLSIRQMMWTPEQRVIDVTPPQSFLPPQQK